ncbi:Mus7/MMS22 family-domain-containing protein [Terfezia claveryi]|nr:Mus7/MMS22 family-domain-containing protein [Terfezia claveryi]
MTSWRDKGYVPDSDAEEDSDFDVVAEEPLPPHDNTFPSTIGLTDTTSSSANHLYSSLPAPLPTPAVTHNHGKPLPDSDAGGQCAGGQCGDVGIDAAVKPSGGSETAFNDLHVLDLSELPEEDDEQEMVYGRIHGTDLPANRKGANLDDPSQSQGRLSTHGSSPSPSATKRPQTPQTRIFSSQEFSPLSDLPSNFTTPSVSPSSRHARFAAFSIVIPQASTSVYRNTTSPPSALSSEDDDFTSGPLRNLRQRKPIQLNPYLVEQARYRATLKARGLKPVTIRPEQEQHAQAQPDPEADEYQASGDDEDESQPMRRPQSVWEDSQFNEIRLAQAAQAGDDDHSDIPDVATVFRGPIRRDKTEIQEVKRRKLAHTYDERSAAAPTQAIWKQPSTPGPHMSKLHEPRRVRVNTPPIQDDVYAMPSDGSSPVRPSQRRPLAQRSINTASTASMAHVISSDDDSTPRASGRRSRALSISSTSTISSLSSSASATSNISVDLRKLQRRTNGVLPASWWKLDYKKRKAQEAVVAGKRRRESTSPARRIHQPGIARAKISKKRRPEAESIFSLAGDDASASPSDGPDEPLALPSLTRISGPLKAPTKALQAEKTVGTWLGLDDDIIMEVDRIDAMLPKASKKKQTTLNITRTIKHRQEREGFAKTPRRRYRVSTTPSGADVEYRSALGLKRTSAKAHKSRPPRLSIVDVYKYQKATEQLSPLQFVKIAHRSAKKRVDQARRGPERKLFVLETESSTREIQNVVREWREGTLDVVAYTQKARAQAEQSEQIKRSDGMNKGDPRGDSLQFPLALSHIPRSHRSAAAHHQKRHQTTLPTISIPTVAADRSRKSLSTKSRRSRQTILKPVIVPAQVQALSEEFHHKSTSPERVATPLIDILRKQRPARPTAFSHPALSKFLQDSDLVVSPLVQLRKERKQIHSDTVPVSLSVPLTVGPVHSAPTRLPIRRARRKNTPQRIDAETRERRQPPAEHIPIDFEEPIQIDFMPSDQGKGTVVTGFAPYGTRYSVNFDTHPLKSGTIFNAETFIGGAGLSKALSTSPAHARSFCTRIATCVFGDQTLYWGAYRDGIATEFEDIMEKVLDGIDKEFERRTYEDVNVHCFASKIYSFYQFCSSYVAEVLQFADAVDLVSFGQRFLRVLHNCSTRVSTAFSDAVGKPDLALQSTKLGIQTQWFTLLLAFQIDRLCVGAAADVRRSLNLDASIRELSRSLISRLCRCGIDVVRQCYEDQRSRSRFERGIGGECYVIEAWVIAIYTLDRLSSPSITFWGTLNSELHSDDLAKVTDIGIYERCWRTMFSLLPLFQFDPQGIVAQPGKREHQVIENWELLKRLTSAFFGHYKYNWDKPTINDYCRIIYTRTHHLITKWRWINPESMIATLFNFFASNSLPNLRNEQDYGSPLFLQNLDKQPSLVTEESDRCFHLLLKIIAVGLNSMKTTSPFKKIRDYVFRLMPNHRRQYPKEEDLSIEHLTALRNHHDLLCVLYWASPPGCRPPISAMRDLVDPKSSHIQACVVSVRAWSHLIRFQLHTEEDIAQLKPLMDWYEDISEQTLTQHHTCRAEVTKQFNMERERGNFEISEADLEDNIRRNHRQLEGLLLEAVRALYTAMSSVKGKIPSAMKLLTPAATGSLFSSFNKLSHKLVMEGLEVVTLYLNACQHTAAPPAQSELIPEQASEESQDYGDWSGMEDLVLAGEMKAAGQHMVAVVYEPLLRMVSSALGADQQPTDILLLRAIDTWVRVAGFLVQHGLKTWDMYLDNYSRESWASFRDTLQTRKFTAYYMSRLIDTCHGAYSSNKPTFLSYWLQTLVERKATLQYQHEFTNALLNADPKNPILQNLPFARTEAGVYKINLSEFEARRLSLIGTVLANMRISYDNALSHSTAILLGGEYTTMLQYLMNSMRENYLTLHQNSCPNPSNPNTPVSSLRTDAYVAFVQQIVSLLQQHTPDILPIDKFFTDSSAFPLPSDDPTYLIGKLRNYGLKLTQPRTHKQLTAFFQTVCDRAAVDGEQEYLVNQLVLAMEGEREYDGNTLTLRSFLMRGIFPAYVQCAFGHETAGWVLAMPIIRAATRVVEGIRAELDSCEFGAVRAVISTLGDWVSGVLGALLEGLIAIEMGERGWFFHDPNPLGVMLVLAVESVVGCLPVLDWLVLQPGQGDVEDETGIGSWRMEGQCIVETMAKLVRIIAWINENVFYPPSAVTISSIRSTCSTLGTSFTPSRVSRGPINEVQHIQHIQHAYLKSLHSSLTHEWHHVSTATDDLMLFRNGARRMVNQKSTTSWTAVCNGVEVDDPESCILLAKRVFLEFLMTAARTETWGEVVMEERRDIWEGEIGRGGRRGRGESAGLFF